MRHSSRILLLHCKARPGLVLWVAAEEAGKTTGFDYYEPELKESNALSEKKCRFCLCVQKNGYKIEDYIWHEFYNAVRLLLIKENNYGHKFHYAFREQLFRSQFFRQKGLTREDRFNPARRSDSTDRMQ